MSERKLVGRDLDALVAEKVFGAFGFENIDVINGTPNELFAVLPGNRAVNRVPYFSTDIAAAWEVVERLNTLGWLAAVKAMPEGVPFLFDESKVMSRAVVSLQWVQWMKEKLPEGEREYWRHDELAIADTVPLAICLAALKAVDA